MIEGFIMNNDLDIFCTERSVINSWPFLAKSGQTLNQEKSLFH